MHLIYIHLSSPISTFPPFLFSGAISRRWRSDTFDNSGPRGVNTEAIARALVPLCASIYQHINIPFTHMQTVETGPKKDEFISMKALKTSHYLAL